MSENLNVNTRYLISLLRALVHEGASFPAPEAGVDYSKLYAIAETQGLSCMLYHALFKLGFGNIDPDTAALLRKTHMAYVQHSVMQELEYYKTASEFDRLGIDFMPLKGWYTRDIYPEPVMRYMGDIDLLIKPDDSKRVFDAMTGLGYSCDDYMQHDDDTYRKAGIMFEIHRKLDTEGLKDASIYDEPFRLAVNAGAHCYKMRPADAYIYTIVHGMKHFMFSGTGLRTLLDIYLFAEQSEVKDRRSYIESCAEKMGISKFLHTMEALAENTFGSPLPLEENELDEASVILVNFLVNSGSGGKSSTLDMALLDRSGRGCKGGSRKSYLFRMIFPTLESMQKRDPILKKAPYLLPVMYVRRWFQLIFCKRERLKNSIERYNAIEESEVEWLRGIHRLAGLE